MVQAHSLDRHEQQGRPIVSVEEVDREGARLAGAASPRHLAALAGPDPLLTVEALSAGYGRMEILHDFHLYVGRGQSLCLIGPNGAGKSTVLHAIYGFSNVFSGQVAVGSNGARRDVTRLAPSEKLHRAGIAYVLQDKSIFPDMTVEENLWMGAYLLDSVAEARRRADAVFDRYARLAERRRHAAKVLSGGERRLLEISRALIMDPAVLLVDEPSIGLEPRFIDMVFEMLSELQHRERKTIVMVEQNAARGLEFADIGYVLVSGGIAMAASGRELLGNRDIGRLFLGG